MGGEEVAQFVERWARSGGAERANYQLFLSELAALIEAPPIGATAPSETANNYVFEKAVRFKHADGSDTTGFIDLYKRGCFVCEAKQSVKVGKRQVDLAQIALFGEEDAKRTRTGTARAGTPGWDLAMERARRQAEGYAKALPKEHGWPPFLVIVDVGNCIELFADFSGQGKNYAQFPDRRSFRIALADLARADIRQQLKLVWTDPSALDPAKRSAEVTRDIAERLAIVAKDLERRHEPQAVALFLMRCLFTMFAEDVELLPKGCFQGMLERYRGKAHLLQHALTDLWSRMNVGGFSSGLEDKVRQFNGGLFKDAAALDIDEGMLGELIVAARRDWRDVEPAIFGTLLERALSAAERSKLGAHYTPRAYVERLVIPTIMEPLQEDWAAARVEAQQALDAADKRRAIRVVQNFLVVLCNTRVLDPACGTGNFLYVAMELMKRLEGEVREYLHMLGGQEELGLGAGATRGRVIANTIDPHNFLGIELNPRAKEIAELVLWIGFLKWQLRTNGPTSVADPVLRDFKTMEWRDAVLRTGSAVEVLGLDGTPEMIWDGRTKKAHPVTGKAVPDTDAVVSKKRFESFSRAEWPDAEFIVGNPPYIGVRRMRERLDEHYILALRSAYAGDVPNTADLVMYWWHKAAEKVASGNCRAFGFITTDSITQDYSRPVLQNWLQSGRVSLRYAVTKHPWVENEDGAHVRVAMTVGVPSNVLHSPPKIGIVIDPETATVEQVEVAEINSSLRPMPKVLEAPALLSNAGICFQGVVPAGDGFKLSPAEAARLPQSEQSICKPYVIGQDLIDGLVRSKIIDAYGLSEAEFRDQYPALYGRLSDTVLPVRRTNPRKAYRDRWWVFAEPRPDMRRALGGLNRYIGTAYTAEHRCFVFLDEGVLPDAMVYAIALRTSDALAVLSSSVYRTWFNATAGGLQTRPRFNSRRVFDPFPFPEMNETQRARLATLGEELDRFRKQRQAQIAGLTLTDIYNVIDKLWRSIALSDADLVIYDRANLATLKRIHDDIDAATLETYGWSIDLSPDATLEQLVTLNNSRSMSEKRGKVLWLRPELQAEPGATGHRIADEQSELDVQELAENPEFPDTVGDRARAVRNALMRLGRPATPQEVWQTFRNGGSYAKSVRELLETMTALGQAVESGGRYFSA